METLEDFEAAMRQTLNSTAAAIGMGFSIPEVRAVLLQTLEEQRQVPRETLLCAIAVLTAEAGSMIAKLRFAGYEKPTEQVDR